MQGCDIAFNAMGLPEQWLADEKQFERVNARGTEAVVLAAVGAGVRRVVHTSTIDVFPTPRAARASTNRRWPPTRRAPRTSVRSSWPKSWHWAPPREPAPTW